MEVSLTIDRSEWTWNALFLPGCRGKGNAGGLQESDVEGQHLIGGFLNRDTPDNPSH